MQSVISTHNIKRWLFIIPAFFAVATVMAGKALAADWYVSDWNYRKPVTVQAGQVTGGPHTDFPMLLSLASDTDLAADAQPDFDDILFTASDGTTKLNHEIESFDSGTGALIAWVRIPAPGINNGTVIYMYYGNGSIGSQQNITGTWNSNYKGVWHLKETVNDEGTSSNAHIDSSGNSNNGDQNGNNETTGKISNGQNFDGNDYIDGGSDNSLKPTTALTVEAWVYRDDPQQVNWNTILATNSNDWWRDGYGFSKFNLGNRIHFWLGNISSDYSNNNAFTASWPTGWHYVVGTFQGGTAIRIYLDGVEGTADTTSVPASISYNQSCSSSLHIGTGTIGGCAPAYYVDNVDVDEVRISNTDRSQGWIITSYNNQNDPNAFHGVPGSEENTFTWDGSASTDWNTPANWDLNAVPGPGHIVVIPDVANDPVLDTTRTAAALTINGETLDLNGNSLTVAGDLTINSSGILDASTGMPTVIVGGSWDASGGTFMPGGGTVRFNGTGAQGITSGGSPFNDLVFNNAGCTWTLQDALDVDNDLTITAGTLDANGNNIEVAGNWTNNGTFTAGTGMVTLNGTGTQDVWSGGSAFNTLEITNSFSDVTFLDDLTATNFTSNTPSVAMRFNAGSTYTITNLTLNGTEGNRITLRSTSPGTQWNLNVSGTQSLSYADVSDSDASGGNQIICTNQCVGRDSNNDNWIVGLVSIPTMTEWGMIIFMILAGFVAVYYLRVGRFTCRRHANLRKRKAL